MTNRAPALFVGHGSPMNAIEDTPFSRAWAELGARLDAPAAIACVSAHWVTDGVRVSAAASPPTIHDFRGFPPELSAVRYPAPGAPALAARIAGLLTEFGAATDDTWGLDHGAWSVLRWLFPNADVPVLQISLDARRDPAAHAEIARALAPLREEGVLILGSGNIVHNLRAFFSGADAPWARQFDDAILAAIESGDADAVANYRRHPLAAVAAPDWEHFMPLVYVLGARLPGETPHVFNRYAAAGISMTSVGFGLPAAADAAA